MYRKGPDGPANGDWIWELRINTCEICEVHGGWAHLKIPSNLPIWSNLPEEWTFLHNNCDWNKHLEKNKRSTKPHTHSSRKIMIGKLLSYWKVILQGRRVKLQECSDIVIMKLMARNSVGSVLLDTGMSVECHREDLFTMTYSWKEEINVLVLLCISSRLKECYK